MITLGRGWAHWQLREGLTEVERPVFILKSLLSISKIDHDLTIVNRCKDILRSRYHNRNVVLFFLYCTSTSLSGDRCRLLGGVWRLGHGRRWSCGGNTVSGTLQLCHKLVHSHSLDAKSSLNCLDSGTGTRLRCCVLKAKCFLH